MENKPEKVNVGNGKQELKTPPPKEVIKKEGAKPIVSSTAKITPKQGVNSNSVPQINIPHQSSAKSINDLELAQLQEMYGNQNTQIILLEKRLQEMKAENNQTAGEIRAMNRVVQREKMVAQAQPVQTKPTNAGTPANK